VVWKDAILAPENNITIGERFFAYAKRDIVKGEELFVAYNNGGPDDVEVTGEKYNPRGIF